MEALSKTSRELTNDEIISEIQTYLKDLEDYKGYSPERLKNDFNFSNLVLIKIRGFIDNTPLLSQEYKKRVNYFEDLVNNKDFIMLVEKINSIKIKLLDSVDTELLDKWNVKNQNQFTLNWKTKGMLSAEDSPFNAQDAINFCSAIDYISYNSEYMVFLELIENNDTTPLWGIRWQATKFLYDFIATIKNEKCLKNLQIADALIEDYKTCQREFDRILYEIPRELSFKYFYDFENYKDSIYEAVKWTLRELLKQVGTDSQGQQTQLTQQAQKTNTVISLTIKNKEILLNNAKLISDRNCVYDFIVKAKDLRKASFYELFECSSIPNEKKKAISMVNAKAKKIMEDKTFHILDGTIEANYYVLNPQIRVYDRT